MLRTRAARLLSAAAVCALAGHALAADASAPQIARGVVFEDRNDNGTRDPGERGIFGVAVSNGREVVRTDAAGAYALPVTDDTVLFVCKPRNYAWRTDANNVPRFSYIHRPAGSPDHGYRFPVIEPTGPLPASIDFGLLPSEEPDRFSIIAVGDPQPYSRTEVDFYARDIVEDIIANGHDKAVAFGMSLGDLVGDDPSLFEPLNNAQAAVGVPWVNVFGNHDMNFMSPNDADSDDTYQRTYGPTTHAFQHGPVHFIVLDDVIWQGFDGLRDNGKPKNGNYVGGLTDDQLSFIENYLADVPTDALIVLAFHIPIEGDGVHRIPQQDRLFRILSRFPHTLSLSGHTHYQRHWFFGSEAGYTAGTEHHHFNAATGSGSWYRGSTDETGVPHATMRCGAPNGYNLIEFDGNRYATTFQAARRPAGEQMRLTAPDGIAAGTPATLIANVYAGSERDRVEFSLNNGAWQPMAFTPQEDPSLRAIKALEASDTPPNGRKIPDLDISYHIWSADLPADAPAGSHVIRVRWIDLYGRTHTDTRLWRVEPASATAAAE
jgi:hypothetical protein